jgi:hypothetical protein
MAIHRCLCLPCRRECSRDTCPRGWIQTLVQQLARIWAPVTVPVRVLVLVLMWALHPVVMQAVVPLQQGQSLHRHGRQPHCKAGKAWCLLCGTIGGIVLVGLSIRSIPTQRLHLY